MLCIRRNVIKVRFRYMYNNIIIAFLDIERKLVAIGLMKKCIGGG